MARYGRLRLEKHPVHGLVLVSNDRPVLEEVLRAKKVAPMVGTRIDDATVAIPSDTSKRKWFQSSVEGRDLNGIS